MTKRNKFVKCTSTLTEYANEINAYCIEKPEEIHTQRKRETEREKKHKGKQLYRNVNESQ